MAWLPPRGYSRQEAGLYHSLNMKATSAAIVPSAGRPGNSNVFHWLVKRSMCSYNPSPSEIVRYECPKHPSRWDMGVVAT